ncbi:MAG: hypothetical protein R2710_14985 [Acidimicrobiales bacterium]
MLRHDTPLHLPTPRFDTSDPWRLVETEYDGSDLGLTETLFALGNGYLGMRANPEEGREAHSHGTVLNGFHETWPIQHAENAYGFATTGQTIVNAPDAKVMKIYVDDEPLLLGEADLDHYERVVDFRAGTLTRDLVWRTPSGGRVQIRHAAPDQLRVSPSRRGLGRDHRARRLGADRHLVPAPQPTRR